MMGTNYYVRSAVDDPDEYSEGIHIGKRSGGWAFALCSYPRDSELPTSWKEWREYLAADRRVIRDEYGNFVALQEFFDIVEKNDVCCRRAPPDYCLEYGEGPWDYLKPDFS